MYRIKLQSGEESEFDSFEELCFGIVSGIIGPDDEIYHARATKWLPVRLHPDYKRAAIQVPPPRPATASQPSDPPGSQGASHDPPEEEEAGQDLMTLLDLEELTAFNPGKVQESAPHREEAEPEPEVEEVPQWQVPALEKAATNGRAHPEPSASDDLDELAAEAEDPATAETDDPESVGELEEEAVSAEVDQFDQETVDEADAQAAAAESLETAVAEADGGDDFDPAAAEDEEMVIQEQSPVVDAVQEDVDECEADSDETGDELFEEHGEGAKDIDYIAAEDSDDLPMRESPVAFAENDEALDITEVESDEDDQPVDEMDVTATLDVAQQDVAEVVAWDDHEVDEDAEGEEAAVVQAGDDGEDEDLLLGGPVLQIDRSINGGMGQSETDDDLEPADEVVFTAPVADPIAEFTPDMDDAPFGDTFSPMPDLGAPRRFPVLPVAIAAGVVVVAALGWMLMGPSGSDDSVAVPEPEGPAPVTAPAANANLNQQSLAAADPREDLQRRYNEAHGQAEARLDADLRSAGFAAVFAPNNFASEASMRSARSAITGARLAVTAFTSREQAIAQDFSEADPTAKESRANRELSEDLLAVSERIYGLLLANTGTFALRNGAITITDRAVETTYTRLLDELNRLMALATPAHEEQAATIRRVVAAIGFTRPPSLAELAPPPALPTDL